MKKPKILLFDLETSPLVGMTWGLYEQNVLKVIESWRILCFSYKWLGGKTKVIALPHFDLYKKNPKNDYELVKQLRDLLDEADILIGQNSDRFDIKKANAKFIEHGLEPPSPYKTIDTLKIAKKHFKFDSNKLGDLGQLLGVGTKVETGGFSLWEKCMEGDERAWKKMIRYNRQDVDLLEKVYLKLRPWTDTHPNLNIFEEKENSCPRCQSTNIQKRGFSITTIGKKQRFVCLNCGGWATSTKIIKTNLYIK